MKLQNEIQQLQERHEVINKDQVPRDVLKVTEKLCVDKFVITAAFIENSETKNGST